MKRRALAYNVVVLAAGCSLLVVVGCSNPNSQQQPTLSEADTDAIRAADMAYVTAWLENDPEQVIAALTDDAVLMPSGLPVLEGTEEVRAFWWPENSPPTIVTAFTLQQKGAGGCGDLGYVRGSFTLGFEYDGNSYTNRGDYISLLRKLPNSSWRISHRAWNDLPEETD